MGRRGVFLAARWIPAFAAVTLLVVGGAVRAEPAPLVDPALCRTLTKHVPDADVAYQPGVDVHGKPVVPADLEGQPALQLPDKFEIPLTISLAKTLNLKRGSFPADKLGPGTEVQLGMLVVEGDRVTFNGQPISDEQQDRLSVLCMQPR